MNGVGPKSPHRGHHPLTACLYRRKDYIDCSLRPQKTDYRLWLKHTVALFLPKHSMYVEWVLKKIRVSILLSSLTDSTV